MSVPESEGRGPVVVALEGARLNVAVNRPAKRNALSRETLALLRETFEAHAAHPAVKVAVLSGAGDKSFAAGGDLNDLSGLRTREEAAEMSRQSRAALDAVRRFPVPVIAALNGDALGGGAELAVACDLRVAAAHARIGFVQGRLGITTAWGGGIDLAALVGPARALALVSRCALLSAEDAAARGLVDDVAAPGQDLAERVADFVSPMLALPRQVLAAFKALGRATRDGASREALERIETERFAETWVHDDHWRAADAILNRRAS